MIVTNDEGMQHLLSSKFKIGADASAAAGPVGRDAAADTDLKMRAQVLTYSRARGLFAGIDLHGSAVTQDEDETRLLYGKFVLFQTIFEGKVTGVGMSKPFLAAVTKHTAEAKGAIGGESREGESKTGRYCGGYRLNREGPHDITMEVRRDDASSTGKTGAQRGGAR